MRDDQTVLVEVLARAKSLKRRREHRETRLLTGGAGLLAVAAALMFVHLSGLPGQTAAEKTATGSMLLSSEAGGYLLFAALMFVLGLAVALVISRRHHRKKEGPRPGGEEPRQ